MPETLNQRLTRLSDQNRGHAGFQQAHAEGLEVAYHLTLALRFVHLGKHSSRLRRVMVTRRLRKRIEVRPIHTPRRLSSG